MNARFELAKCSLERLANEVWPKILSGDRTEIFTCYLTALPNLPYVAINFICPRNFAFRDFNCLYRLQASARSAVHKECTEFGLLSDKSLSKLKRYLTKMNEPHDSGFAWFMLDQILNTRVQPGPYFNSSHRHFASVVPESSVNTVIAVYRMLNDRYPTSSIWAADEHIDFQYFDDLVADKSLGVFRPLRAPIHTILYSEFEALAQQAIVLLENKALFEKFLPLDPRFSLDLNLQVTGLANFLAYFSERPANRDLKIDKILKLKLRTALRLSPTIELGNMLDNIKFQGIFDCAASVRKYVPEEYQELSERVSVLDDLREFQI